MTAPTITDPRPLLLRAVDQAGRIIAGIEPDQAGLPTPCDDWDVAALAGHLVAVVRRITAVAEGREALSVAGTVTDVAPTDWGATYDEAAARLRAAWSDDALLDREMRLPFGTFSGRMAAGVYTEELTTHGWDLARASGQTAALDPELALASLEIARRIVPAGIRGDGRVPFGAVVEVPEDADPYLRLAGWMGRSVGA